MAAYLPRYVKQLDGSKYAGLNCTCAVGAMALDRETVGKNKTNGASVRNLTHDTEGGTTQRQVVNALYAGWRVDLDLETYIPQNDMLKRLDAGQGLGMAGQSGATIHTKWRASETFTGNHQWWCNERRKNSQVAGGWEWLIMDPLGDGRRPGIADFSKGLWIPQTVVFDFSRRLNVSPRPLDDYQPLGLGKFWVFFTHDTEPHLELHWGGHPIIPPAAMTIKVPKGQKANKRSKPYLSGKVMDTMSNGERFNAYQKTIKGQKVAGSSTWYGNVDGSRWLHSSAF